MTKNKDWQLTIEASKNFTKGYCGGEILSKNEFNAKFYKRLSVLNRSVVRPLFEEGNLRTIPDSANLEKVPLAQIIQDTKEYINKAKELVIELPFCLEIQDKSLRLNITYHSTFFTVDNFYINKSYRENIDFEILKEMDEIVQSIFIN